MKPIVHFEKDTFELHESHGGTYAKVYTYDHPRLGQEWVRTSLILRDLDDGGFETTNTIYKPVTRSTEA